jgi:FkbM family methyltransferase
MYRRLILTSGQNEPKKDNAETSQRMTAALSDYLYRARERFHPLNRLRRNPLSRAVLSAMDVPIWVVLPGVRWKVRVRLVRHASWFVLSDGVEPGIVALFRAIARKPGIRSFWDVGANVGYYSWLTKSIIPEAAVRMFEPDPDNLALVRETINRAGLSAVTVREVAVSDEPGTRPFALDEISGSTSSILDRGPTYSESQWGVVPCTLIVDTISLDDERAAAGAVDLIKIDVEGHEEAVIRGALETICRDQPILIFECFHGGGEIIDALGALGYAFIDAETMCTDLCMTTNFLALPERHHELFHELAHDLKKEAARK